jgi:hypothetical protein
MEHKAFRVCRVHKAIKEIKVFRELREHKAFRVCRVHKAIKEIKVFRELREL